eukprot:CAMPEP_0179979568 /NCGR_PEP_ID=MMETSP0983-20121128/41431_1 /TAXON_ID=483367 /ORGANISM="non described non described, Strain CCMP 2436" /LENGTH=52 /DNA_ID=CAMNT_0021897369 /DNA_START=793 /DNA_END=947 /DNA_ORIENTATION=-
MPDEPHSALYSINWPTSHTAPESMYHAYRGSSLPLHRTVSANGKISSRAAMP